MPASLFKLRPRGPWRIGPVSGARTRAEAILASDALYSAVTLALGTLGWLDEWLAVTATSREPAVRFTSMFPAQEENLLAPPPAHLWPAPAARLRPAGARLIPTTLIRALALGEGWNEEQWEVDGLSECLLRRGRRRAAGSPYRVGLRHHAAVDRLEPGRITTHETACIEFAEGAGLWCVAEYASASAAAVWAQRLENAFHLLADSGFGGERRQGWGSFTLERMERGELPDLIWGRPRALTTPAAKPDVEESPAVAAAAPAAAAEERGWWLLSLFSPAESDQVDWTRGSFSLVERAGRVASTGDAKLRTRLVREGSVLLTGTGAPLLGRAWNVAPPHFTAHPVWRAGYAVAISLPWRVPA